MRFISLGPSTRPTKKLMIKLQTDDDKIRTFHFGSHSSKTYLDHHDKRKRENYLMRHFINEDWSKINAGSLSAFLLWGPNTNLNDNLELYFRNFNIES